VAVGFRVLVCDDLRLPVRKEVLVDLTVVGPWLEVTLLVLSLLWRLAEVVLEIVGNREMEREKGMSVLYTTFEIIVAPGLSDLIGMEVALSMV
jgi:hypothetical protein